MSGIIGGGGSKSGVIRKHKGINEPAFYIEGGGADGTNEQVTAMGYNLIDWTTPVIDTAGYWVAGTNRYSPTDGVTRKYWVYCYLAFTTGDDIEPLVLNIQKNDNQIFYSKHTNHLETTLFGYGIADLDGIDDYLNVYVYNPTSTPYEIMVHPSKTFFGGYALDITKPFV